MFVLKYFNMDMCVIFQVQPHNEDGIPIDPYMQHGDFVRTGLLGFMGPVSTSV
jgi:hypothetical protein